MEIVAAVLIGCLLAPPLVRESGSSPGLDISLGQPLAGIDQLKDVEKLLVGHDRSAHASNGPRHKRVHLVGPRQLQRTGTVRVQQEGRGGPGWGSRLEGARSSIWICDLQEGWR
jgi:hypothetical protein